MTFIISNENEKLKLGTIPSVRICQNMLEMALRCHHFAYKFQKFPGGGPPDPPNRRGGYPPSIPTPQSHYALLWCAAHTTIIISNPPLLKPAYGPAQCILDSNFSGAEGFISEDQVYQWEFDTRILCYYLHVNRTKLLTATAEATQRRKAAPI